MIKKQVLFFSMNLKECKDYFKESDLPSYVASQVFDWVYKKNCFDFSYMKNISKLNQKKIKRNSST